MIKQAKLHASPSAKPSSNTHAGSLHVVVHPSVIEPLQRIEKAFNITGIERDICHQKKKIPPVDSATTSSPFFLLVGVAAIMMKLDDT